ncbi:TadE/TadG family type IV pilus assembly protein [Azospirillum sp. A39]
MPRRPLAACDRGGTVVEFALALPVLLVAVAAVIELSGILFVDAALESGIRAASRHGSTGHERAGMTRSEAIVATVSQRSLGLANAGNMTVTTRVYDRFAAMNTDEPFSDVNDNGLHDPGEPYEDRNGNGRYDGGVPGPGGANAIVVYTARVDLRFLTPLSDLLGRAGTVRLTATTAVRNEPYDEGEPQ